MNDYRRGGSRGRWLLAIGVIAAVSLHVAPLSAQRTATLYEELQAFSGALNHIRTNYVDSVGYSELIQAAIRGMLRALDPHSTYYRRPAWDELQALERGERSTTGAVIESADGVPTVVTVYPESPAAKQGVQAGDRIVRVNDTTVAGLDIGEVRLLLVGRKGSRVRVTLERGPRLVPEELTLRLKRDDFKVRSVTRAEALDSITGYVRLEEFAEGTAKELRDAIRGLVKRGAKQLVLDLRGNPGGLVMSSVDVAGEFFAKGTLVLKTVGRKESVNQEQVTKSDGDFRELPLIVLIDEWSASAAEALAGSLQDHDRALIVGRRSFGKALMQTAFVLPSGDVIMMTMGRILTPSGRFIQREYKSLRVEAYLERHGKAGDEQDTTVFHTDAGRVVRGGGGIRPDVELPVPPSVPAWFTAAADSGFDDAVADSVAYTLPETPAAESAWDGDPGRWGAALMPSLMARVRSRLGVNVEPDSTVAYWVARQLARRVAEVRWGPEARDRFMVANDGDIKAAIGYFPRLAALLETSRN
jgi:carboxyl-terminal processing protease